MSNLREVATDAIVGMWLDRRLERLRLGGSDMRGRRRRWLLLTRREGSHFLTSLERVPSRCGSRKGRVLLVVVAAVFIIRVITAPVVSVIRIVLGLCPFARFTTIHICFEGSARWLCGGIEQLLVAVCCVSRRGRVSIMAHTKVNARRLGRRKTDMGVPYPTKIVYFCTLMA